YYGVFANKIKDLMGGDSGFVGIMSNGTSGDVIGTDRGSSGPSYEPYEKMAIVADGIAEKVYDVSQTLDYKQWVPIKVLTKNVNLNRRETSNGLINWAQGVISSPPGLHPQETNFANRVIRLSQEPDVTSVVVQTFGIGDLGIGALPYEVFAETGLEIKEESPFATTVVIGLASGAEA